MAGLLAHGGFPALSPSRMSPVALPFSGVMAPRHSTVAGSAVIWMPGLGPPVTFPFHPASRSASREPC